MMTMEDAEEEARRKKKEALFKGCLSDLPSMPSKVVRVFVSSTFSDMVQERNALIEHVYPKLKEFCKQRGLEFQVVDMRWGVREEAQDDHMTSSLCIREIVKCQQLSAGPTFVAFLGQKYGFRPFPAVIDCDEFISVRQALQDSNIDISLIDTWFKQDENSSDNRFCLVPISSILTNYINKSEPDLMRADQTRWWQVFARIQKLLRDGATVCMKQNLLTEEQAQKYFISVTEDEINSGFLVNPSRNRHLVIDRAITDIEQHLVHPRAMKFTDLTPSGAIDQEATSLLNKLKSKKIPAALQACAQEPLRYEVNWSADGGISPDDHQAYLSKFCDDFHERMSELIEKCLSSDAKLGRYGDNDLFVEVLQHLTMCKKRCDAFLGRDDAMEFVKSYIVANSGSEGVPPMVVYGPSGSGKTSIMAMAAKTAVECAPNHVVLVRFLGTSPGSSGIHSVLTSLCQQIQLCYPDLPPKDPPEDFHKLVKHFHSLLQVATSQKPLTVILDSLDQLGSANNAHSLTWLPWKLPPNAHLIISTLPKVHGMLCKLKICLHGSKYFLKVKDLGEDLGFTLVKQRMKATGRKLTEYQNQIVQEALSKCSLPLYTKLVFEEIFKWTSYLAEEKTLLPPTVQSMINMLMEKLEVQHGRILVSHSLAYITAARNGLSECELEDVLSIDDEVLDEVFTFWVPPIRRIPQLLWTRLREDLGNYLVEREANGVCVLAWYHRQFITVATERYLKDKAQKKAIHSTLADYFMGTWADGAKKPFKYGDFICKRMSLGNAVCTADRKVSAQPLYWQDMMGSSVHYNCRKLSEMPFHLYYSDRLEEMLTHIVFNYEWIHAKVKTYALPEMINDMSMAKKVHKTSKIGHLVAVLRVAGTALMVLPNAVSPEILARLKKHNDDDKEDEDANMKQLIEQCENNSLNHCALLPAFQCFDPPAEAVLWSLEGHTDVVTDLVFSSDPRWLYSCSVDGTIAFWDINNGDRGHLVDLTEFSVNKHMEIHTSEHGLVCEMYADESPLLLVSLADGVISQKIDSKHSGNIHSTVVTKNIAIREGQIIRLNDGTVKPLSILAKHSSFVVVALTYNEKHLLIGFEHAVAMIDLISCESVMELSGQNIPSSIVITKDDSSAIIGYAVSCAVSVFNIDITSADFGSKLFSCELTTLFPDIQLHQGNIYTQEVSELVLSNNCSFVLANIMYGHTYIFCLSDFSQVTLLELPIKDSGFSHMQFSSDDKHIIGLCDSSLCLWDMNGKVIVMKTLPGAADTRRCIVASSAANVVATTSYSDHAIKIWDIENLEEFGVKPQQKTYDNPLDTMLTSPQQSLAFIKVYKRLDSDRGYHYLDYFGLDVWDTKTFEIQEFLPYQKFGSLAFASIDQGGQHMCLCTRSGDLYFIYLIHTASGDCVFTAQYLHVNAVHQSVYSEYLLVERLTDSKDKELVVINVGTESTEHTLRDCEHSLVTLDAEYAVCVESKSTLVTLSLCDGTREKLLLNEDVMHLSAIPCQKHVIVICLGSNNTCSKVKLYDIDSRSFTVTLISDTQSVVVDVAKNGSLAVDELLQVFDLGCGELVTRCKAQTKPIDHHLVTLTDSGSHVVWADTEPLHCINAFSVSSQQLVATVSTHSAVCSLALVSGGYRVLAGCSDGHFLAYNLHEKSANDTESDPNQIMRQQTSPFEEQTRPQDWKLMRLTSVSASQVDSIFQSPATNHASPLPVCSGELIKTMEENGNSIRHIVMNTGYSVDNKSAVKPSETASISKGNRSHICVVL